MYSVSLHFSFNDNILILHIESNRDCDYTHMNTSTVASYAYEKMTLLRMSGLVMKDTRKGASLTRTS